MRPSEEHTFLRCPEGTLDDLRPGMVAVVGIPFDATNDHPTGRTPAIGAAVLFAILEPKLFAIGLFGLRG